jgi:hypothetical protein
MSVSQSSQQAAAEVPQPASDGHRDALEQGGLARLAARVRAGSLDHALAEGADPRSSKQLAARARLLTSRCRRIQAAQALEQLVRRAQGPHRRWWALSQHNAVLANSSELHGLASLLRSERPVYAHGVAALNDLLSDGTGPVYRDEDAELGPRLRRVRAALEGRGRDDFGAAVSSTG